MEAVDEHRKQILRRAKEFRKSPTPEENILWERLRAKRLNNFVFRRQFPVGSYILDFYCRSLKLAIEADGGQHADEEKRLYDEERMRFLEANGIMVLRFWNSDIRGNLTTVLDTILLECQKLSAQPSPGRVRGHPLPEEEG